jgi:hypothetical protein
MVHAVPKGVQLPSRHLYLLERVEDKVAAINTRITNWRQWLAAAVAAAAAAPGASAAAAADSSSSTEWSPVGAPVQVCLFVERRAHILNWRLSVCTRGRQTSG